MECCKLYEFITPWQSDNQSMSGMDTVKFINNVTMPVLSERRHLKEVASSDIICIFTFLSDIIL